MVRMWGGVGWGGWGRKAGAEEPCKGKIKKEYSSGNEGVISNKYKLYVPVYRKHGKEGRETEA